jgi:hypothetical protein
MGTKLYEWQGPRREVPKHGMFSPGDKLMLPDDIAESLLRQNLIVGVRKPIKPKKKKKKGA